MKTAVVELTLLSGEKEEEKKNVLTVLLFWGWHLQEKPSFACDL